MLFSKEKLYETYFIVTILTSFANAYSRKEASGKKVLNLKIGFDLSSKENGAPSLRIRDFEELPENIYRQRAYSNEKLFREKTEHAVRADSFSDSQEIGYTKDKVSSQEDFSIGTNVQPNKMDTQSDDDTESFESDSNDRHISTRGIQPVDYEPEDNPKLHVKYQGYDSDVSQYRYKREAENAMKRKTKKMGYKRRTE